MRPWNLHMAPPVRVEIKYGRKNGNRPERLEHFLVVDRIKEDNNWRVIKEVHEALDDDKPTKVPIVLMSDDIQENFGMFRSFFVKGKLLCGSQYGDDKALRRVRDGKDVAPYEVECSQECPFWQSDDKQKQCDISATLYFKLGSHLPRSSEFGVCRMKGSYAQRYMVGSLNILAGITNGILANLPLLLCINTEKKKAQDGRTYSIPLITVQPGLPQDQFLIAVEKEVERRARVYKMMNGEDHKDFEDLKILDVLKEINKREAFTSDEFASEEEPLVLDEDDPFEKLMDDRKITRAQREHFRLKFKGDLEALQQHLKDEDEALDF